MLISNFHLILILIHFHWVVTLHTHSHKTVFDIIQIHVGNVGYQQPIAPTWSRKGGSFSGLTEGTRMPQVVQLYRIIAGVCYPQALLPKSTQNIKTVSATRQQIISIFLKTISFLFSKTFANHFFFQKYNPCFYYIVQN